MGGTLVALSVLLAWVLLIAYPSPLLRLEGAQRIVLIIIVAGIALGPLLTIVVFNPAKKRPSVDLAVVLAFQISALGFGIKTIYDHQPLVLAFVIDRFVVVARSDLPAEFRTKVGTVGQSWRGDVRLVWVKMPWNLVLSQGASKLTSSRYFTLASQADAYGDFPKSIEMLRDRGLPTTWAGTNGSDLGVNIPVIGKAEDGIVTMSVDSGRVLEIR